MTIKPCLLAILAAGLVGCGKDATSEPASTTNRPTAGSNPLNAPTDYLGAVAKAQKGAVKTVDTASLNQAIQLFYAQEDRYPKDLQELVTEKYLPALPTPPAGMKFHYDPKAGSIKIVAP